MAMAVDNTNVGFYGYDGNGERAYKLTGVSDVVHSSEKLSDASVQLDDVALLCAR